MLPSQQFENRLLHGTVASQISAALSEPDGLPEDEGHPQAETLDDNVAAKIEDLDHDVLLEDIPIFTAPRESDDLCEDEGHRQVDTFDDDLWVNFEDLDDNVLPDATPVPAASESDDLLQGHELRQVKILENILECKIEDLDEDGEEAELALAIGDDVLPVDDDEEVSDIDVAEYSTGTFDKHWMALTWISNNH